MIFVGKLLEKKIKNMKIFSILRFYLLLFQLNVPFKLKGAVFFSMSESLKIKNEKNIKLIIKKVKII